jgi:ferrous iron transport protein B
MKSLIIALVGNPNCGKTTLFNGLTGKRQWVGNWPGVTVEKKQGQYFEGDVPIEVVDLPGCYNASVSTENPLDERITQEYLLCHQAELIVNIVDATHLERHLYLTLQLLEKGLPVIVALNMMDAAQDQKIYIDAKALSNRLGCPVVPLVAIKEQGITELKKMILQYSASPILTSKTRLPSFPLSDALENPHSPNSLTNPNNPNLNNSDIHSEIEKAKARYQTIQDLIKATVKRSNFIHSTWSERIDKVLLNRVLGLPFFLMFMYLVFVFSFHVSGIFQDFFDIASRTLFVEGPKHWLENMQAPPWLIGFIALGIGQGLNTTLSFIPVIACMFLCLSFLEASGYMARAAFVMDKIMQWVGLPGKSFVPMIIGFGCNVPAVMATRTLENYRERILTVLMSPFMSCGARLAIYALFVSAFFPTKGQNIIFGLYLIGIMVALLTGFILKTTLLPGERSPLVIEFPPYRWPSAKVLVRTTWHRVKRFVVRAGILIVPLCIFIGTLGSLHTKSGDLFSHIGRTITPIFAPMGLKEDNWPATVGLLTGVLAKEVVVGTLNALYIQELHENPAVVASFSLKEGLTLAYKSILENGVQFGEAFIHPFTAIAPEEPLQKGVLGVMVERFGSTASAFAYLLFVLLYFPCVSVVAVIARELNKSWALFSVMWTTGVAYTISVIFYQSATISENPMSSVSWILGTSGSLIMALWGIRKYMLHKTLATARRQALKRLPTQIILDT